MKWRLHTGSPAFHDIKNYRTEARILDEFGPHTLQKRSLKAGRKKKERQGNGDPRRESLSPGHGDKIHIPDP
jgi:hypothetical protein